MALGSMLIALAIRWDGHSRSKVITLSAGWIVGSVVILKLFGPAGLGAVASMWSIVNKIPQMVESWVRPGGVAISLTAFGISTGTLLAWTAYALLQGDAWLIGCSIFSTGYAMFVITRTIQGRARPAVAPAYLAMQPAGN